MAIRHNSRIHTVDTASTLPTTKKELKKDSRGLVHSEACVLRDFEDFTFCGTDNGLVNMTADVPFSLNRFSFHLKLHNHYSVLDDDNKAAPVVQDIELQKYLKTPKATIISASEIDFGCGAFKQRVKRQTGKKLTRKGKEVQLIENSLSQKVISTSNVSVEQLKHNFDAHVEHRKKLRGFYNTGNRMNERRHREIQKHRFTHRICTKERKALSQTSGNNPSTKKKLVMFIGDRGTGVGSRIKGFKRYGGRWKEVIHSEEANSVQMCCQVERFSVSKIEAEKYITLTSPSRFEEETGSYAVVLE
ncbi:hypothetical protein G6F48_008166 [Rhizopus delemar]|nr:hypothetical protein G6F48_008166 [Rhizopus delemar]